jgi:hypothetical protein
MATLEIQCFLDECQMARLSGLAAKCLFDTPRSRQIEDIDVCIGSPQVRMCVEYSIGMDNVELKQAEILDKYWNVLDADSAVLRQRLQNAIGDYNQAMNS